MRRNSRILAFKYIYSSFFTTEEIDLNSLIIEEEKFTNDEIEYAMQIVSFFNNNKNELNQRLKEKLIGYELDRVYKIDIALIFLALCEIKYLNIPISVATNESLELAKIFSTEKSSSFINGVLAGLLGGDDGK